HIGVGIDQRMPHTCLRSQMHNGIYVLVNPDKIVNRVPIGYVRAADREPRPLGQPLETGLLQPDVVIRAQVVQTDHALAPAGQRPGHVTAEEPGCARKQDRHSGRATRRSSSSSRIPWPSAMWHSWMRAVSLSGTSRA